MKTGPNLRKGRVLHITAHLGGGVGRVLLSYLQNTRENSDFDHKIISLGYTEDSTLFDSSKSKKFPILDQMASNHREIINEIAKADITLIHWWNHPLLYDFLVRNPLPENRVVMWSHVSGLQPPQIFTKKIIQYSDLFVFTTPISFESQDIKNLPPKQKNSLRVVWSTAGVDHVKSVEGKEHTGFNIGYIGTVDYAKIHRNFLNMASRIKIPNVKFIVCGGSDEGIMAEEAKKIGIAEKINFTGHIKDISKYLEIFDVFGYPLSSHHYGTCDQVIAESMAAGVVPIVLPNAMEKYMIKHRLNGIIAKNEDSYVRAIHKLYRDSEWRKSLSMNAKEYALKTFSLKKMTQDWEEIFNELLLRPKMARKWDGVETKKITPKDVFLESLGDHGRDFLHYCYAKSEEEKTKAAENIRMLKNLSFWQAKTKGTVHNYSSFFPKDKHLSIWSKLME